MGPDRDAWPVGWVGPLNPLLTLTVDGEPMTDASLIVVSEFDGYAVLRLNRPEKHNAINTAMRIEFMEA